MINIDFAKTGKHILNKCKDAGYSPKDISLLLNTTLSAPYYWFEGKSLPKLETLLNLAKLLNCSIDELLVIEGPADMPNLVLHPDHYNHADRKECWSEMIEISPECTAIFDLWSAYKYSYRAGTKQGNPEQQDRAKIENYINHANAIHDAVKFSEPVEYAYTKMLDCLNS